MIILLCYCENWDKIDFFWRKCAMMTFLFVCTLRAQDHLWLHTHARLLECDHVASPEKQKIPKCPIIIALIQLLVRKSMAKGKAGSMPELTGVSITSPLAVVYSPRSDGYTSFCSSLSLAVLLKWVPTAIVSCVRLPCYTNGHDQLWCACGISNSSGIPRWGRIW